MKVQLCIYQKNIFVITLILFSAALFVLNNDFTLAISNKNIYNNDRVQMCSCRWKDYASFFYKNSENDENDEKWLKTYTLLKT